MTHSNKVGKVGHTPGPWRVLNPTEVKKIYALEAKDNPGYRVVADDPNDKEDDWPWVVTEVAGAIDDYGNEEANANLIASAPELLDALQIFSKGYEQLIDPSIEWKTTRRYISFGESELKQAFDAVRKAEGNKANNNKE